MLQIQCAPFDQVIASFRAGKMVVLVDDARRENEGDLVIATEKLTTEAVSFMMREARGLICVSISRERAQKLNLPLQVLSNNSPFNTPFTVSVDHRSVGNDGVTASSRVKTMRALVDPDARPEDFVSPGHVFPLIANPLGVIGRQGQTEGSFDLARFAGFSPSGVICEILGSDGNVVRGKALQEFADSHDILISSVEEIIRHRVREEILLREVARSPLHTDYGTFLTCVFQDDVDGKEHLALVKEPLVDSKEGAALVRIHSECLTGDVFGSRRCDCGAQLAFSLAKIAEQGGVLLYLQQEGRGIGLGNKLQAYALQDQGHDTVEANIKLGFPADMRDYAVAARMLHSLGVRRVRLLTNNPDKVAHLAKFAIEVSERIPVIVQPDEFSVGYLRTKKEKMGHLL